MTAVEALTEPIGQFDQERAGLEKQGLQIVIDEEDIDFCRLEGRSMSMSLGVSLDLAKALLMRAKAEDAANIVMHQIAEDRWTFFEHRPSCNCVPCMRHVERSVGGGGV
jgi:hypothetical protein